MENQQSMKTIFNKFVALVQSLKPIDFIMILFSTGLVLVFIYGVWANVGFESLQSTRKSNKALIESTTQLIRAVKVLESNIESEKKRANQYKTELDSVAKISNSFSVKYEQQKQKSKNEKSNYSILPIDKRVGVFAKQISGGH